MSSRFFAFFPFLVNNLHFILELLIHVKNYFSFPIILYVIIVIITNILFFSTLPVIGGEVSKWTRVACSTPTHWLLWVSRRVSVIFIFILFYFIFFSCFFYKLFFGNHRWGVDTLFYIYYMTSFNYDAMGERNVGLSCRCHLSNSHIVSPA